MAWFPTRKSVSTEMESEHGRGAGSATITLERVKGRLCFRLNWAGIGTPVAAHIHEVTDGTPDCAVIPLFVDTPKRRGCVNVSQSLLAQIADCPGRYYVTLRTQSHPGGALYGRF